MGVPKFFRYISERYPCLSELIRESQIPDFDNLYLDMNGIIHNCSHPDDGNIHFRMTEEQMFLDIFHYIETLFRLIRPQKVFFMAVDGVAPRAKMNQQRGRRFRSAKEAEKMEEDARKKGEKLPDTERFDSNCITPGTAFMVRLQDALRHFVKVKITTNPLWQKCKIILSGHETPGEGEHKIMEYIRCIKSKPGFDPNTRHCLYGLDADLVMLGLCSHELHFSLLREEVKFGSKVKKPTGVDQTRFYLLHLGLLREYLELEFARIKDSVPFGFDIEKIVDDWILMGFFVGNDFIPHLPNLHINENALPILYETYMDVLPTLDGYINEGGKLNLERLNAFMKQLAVKDKELFANQRSNFKGLKSNEANDETFNVNLDDMNLDMDVDLMELVKSSNHMFDDDDDDDFDADADDDQIFEKEFLMHKRDYYIKKLKYPEVTPDVLAEQTECYIRALQWTLFYYYRGVQSWGWYYPHHYSPYISDIQNFSNLKLDFDMGKPFLPFEQLLAVLPAASRSHLPSAYHSLMMDDNSSVIDFYPKDFDTDMNGKKQEWEAVVLIPFIDENRLLHAMSECQSKLSGAEVKRNVHGPMYCYEFSKTNSGILDAQYGLSSVNKLHCKETPIYRDELAVAEKDLVLGPSKGALSDVYFPGFPTMKHLKYTGSLKFARTRVFDQPSRNDSMVVLLEPHPSVTIQDVAASLLGKEIFVGWPHLSEGKVISVMDESTVISSNGMQNDKKIFNLKSKTVVDHYMNRMGIDLGDIQILVCVAPLRNREYTFGPHGKMALNKMWGEPPVFYPIQSIVRDIAVHDPHYVKHRNVVDIFTVGSKVFMADTIYVGSMGVVTDPTPVKECGRIKLSIEYYSEPNLEPAKRLQSENSTNFINSYSASSSIGMHSSVFNLVTGSFIIVRGEKRFPLPDNTPKANIGLQLKFPKKNEEVVGYSKKIGNQFMYSKRAIELVEQYWKKFPDVFSYMSNNSLNEQIFESDLFQGKTGALDEVVKWIKEQPYFSASTKRSCGSNGLDEMAMKMVVQMVNLNQETEYKNIKLQAKPHLLLKPGLNTPNPEANHNFRVLDRVVIVSETFSVPLGYKGTITAVHTITDPNPVRLESVRKTDVLYEVLFDKPFDEGNSVENVAEKRFFNVPPMHLLNITQGLKAYNITKPADSVQQTVPEDKKNIWEQLKKSSETKKPANPKPNIAAVPETIGNNSNQQLHSKQPPTTDHNDESDVLRKLLKIQLNKETEPAVIKNVSYENSTKINVSDLFRVDPAHPPKPPQNWHSQKANRSKVYPQAEVAQPKGNSQFYPPQTTKPNYIHHPRPNSAVHRSPIHNDNNFTIINQILPPQGPRGPPHLGKYPPPGHHGAFIPLQAARSISKSNSKETDNKLPKPKPDHNKMNISTNQQSEPIGGHSETNAKKCQAQKRPTKMRVAANFNFPSNSVDKD